MSYIFQILLLNAEHFILKFKGLSSQGQILYSIGTLYIYIFFFEGNELIFKMVLYE